MHAVARQPSVQAPSVWFDQRKKKKKEFQKKQEKKVASMSCWVPGAPPTRTTKNKSVAFFREKKATKFKFFASDIFL